MKKYLFILCCFFQHYLFSQPVINSFSPEIGPIGTSVTIAGSGFSTIANNNIVFFGAVSASVINASATAINVKVPPGASYQPIAITVAGLTGYAQKPFRVTFNCGTFIPHTFTAEVDTNILANSGAGLAIKDFDNDGKPDLITSDKQFVSVFKNTSPANGFSLGPSFKMLNNYLSTFIVCDDMDGDGKPDILITHNTYVSSNTSVIAIFKNSSTVSGLSFESPITFGTGGGYGLATADLDGDGKPDVMSTDNDQGLVSVHKNTTVGGILSFAPEINYATGVDARTVSTGYINADNKPDMVVTNQEGQSFSVLINTSTPGNISFNSKIDFATTPGGYPEAITVTDLDGDGKADVVVTNNNAISATGTVSVFMNMSEGNNIAFAPRLDLVMNSNNPYSLAISDIDGDGKPDIIVNNQVNTVISMFKNTSVSGTMSFTSETAVEIADPDGARRVMFIDDLNGDGMPDIVESAYDAYSITVLLNAPGKPVITSFLPTEACEGTIVTISGTSLTGVTAVSFGGMQAASFSTVSPTTITAVVGTGASGAVSINGACGNAGLDGFIFNTASVPASVSANASALSVCAGTAVTFTATPVNGGATPTYQWQINSANVGTNSVTFISNSLKDNDTIKVIMTSALACVSNSPATSNSIVMNVLQPVSAAINITASAINICPGNSVTFTATPTNEGSNPVYQWHVNNIDEGTSNAIFTTNSLRDGDVVTCTLTSNYACVSVADVFSNSIKINEAINAVPLVTIISSASSICKGAMVTFIATPVNGGIAPVYQWKVNGINEGLNNALFSTNIISDGDIITCSLTNAGSCNPVTSAISNEILIHVNTSLPPSISITASKNNVCPNTEIIFTASAANVISTASFQWKLNGSDIGADTKTYSGNNFVNADKVYCVMNTASDCLLSSFINSDTIDVIVKPVPSVSFSPSTASISFGNTVQLQAKITGSFDSYVWTPVTGLNNATILNPLASPAKTTVYKLAVTAADCNTENSITVTVLTNIYIPASFSPNGDGVNDIFRIPPGIEFNLTAFIVYDKYGNEIFKTSNITKGWDGTYKGVNAAIGNYVYLVKGTGINGEILLKGNVLLIR